ncbi:MAG: CBS domain-containing protein, partial [Planctomycetota bacterium]
IFNLIPALPLDGGRVVRSLLALGMEHTTATRIAAWISKALAILLVVVGIYSGQFWYLLIAGFIWLAVSAETRQSTAEQGLRGLPLRVVMQPEVIVVPERTPLGALVATMFQRRHTQFPVVDDAGEPIGTIGLRDLGEDYDPHATVGSIMRREVATIPVTADALRAFEMMGSRGVGRLIVVDPAGRMVGIVARSDLMRALQLRNLLPGARPETGPNTPPDVRPDPRVQPHGDSAIPVRQII